jgi:DNA-directed RNA polymerase subunit beta
MIKTTYEKQKNALNRRNFAKIGGTFSLPNLIEIQTASFEWFLKTGLNEVFEDIFPISDYSNHLSLEFVDFQLCEEDKKYTIEECKERDATYAAPLKVRVRLVNKAAEDMPDIPHYDSLSEIKLGHLFAQEIMNFFD